MQLIKNNRGVLAKISIILVIAVVLIGAGIALQGEISKPFAAPVVVSFDASSSTITSGQSATLQWEVTGAKSVSISPDVGTVSSSGTWKVSPQTTTTYTLVANNMSGSARKSTTIAVSGILPSIANFSFNTDSIYAGQSATLSWNVIGATSVSINPDLGTVSSTGTQSMSPGLTTTYTLTASNSAGNPTASATIKVAKPGAPIINSFSASQTSINSGQSSTLTWDVIGSASIYINQGVGAVPPKGSKEVTPAATTAYTLTADDGNSKATKSVTVTVDTTSTTSAAITTTPPTINSFSASRNSIMLGDNITLTWSVARARTVSISPDIGTVPVSGWTMAIPAGATTYKLSATNTFGTETADVAVTVNKSTEGTAPSIKSFTAVPSSIPRGGISSLSWVTKGATVFTIDKGIGIPASKYSQPVSPAESTTYTLTVINSSGTDNATVTVTVVP